jgi:hypothetical protein
MTIKTAAKLAKITAKIAVSSGCSKIVHDVIDAHVTADTTFEKVQVWVGSIALASAASNAAWTNLENTIIETKTAARAAKELKDNEILHGEVV